MTEPTPDPIPENTPGPIIEAKPETVTITEVSKPVRTRFPFLYILLWIIAVTSLLLNVVIIKTLLDVKQQAAIAFSNAAASMGTIQSGTIEYTVKIDEEIPVALDVPVKFIVEVPIKRTIPIDTVVDVPIEFFGSHTIQVPISTTIPIDLTVQIPVDQNIPINGKIPVKFDVPIKLNIGDTAFGEGLGQFQLVLEQQAQSLGAPK